jgi:ElaB/YqjD/DUF883 family membrane-anchored ribosome-binding protein
MRQPAGTEIESPLVEQEETMRNEVLEKVAKAEGAVAEAVEERLDAARRAAKRVRRAAEDWVEDAEHRIKKHPLRTVGICFGVGLGLGAVLGTLLAHRRWGTRP